MKTLNIALPLLLISSVVLFNACKKQGCTDPNAYTYNEKAKKDDGTCLFTTTIAYWTDNQDKVPMEIYIDNELQGVITKALSFIDSTKCEASEGVVLSHLKAGSYVLTSVLEDGSSGSISLDVAELKEPEYCYRIRLQ